MLGGNRTYLRVSSDPMFEWISSNGCSLNLLVVRSHQSEVIIVKRLIQGRNNVTRVRVEPRSCDQGCKNDAFALWATLPTIYLGTCAIYRDNIPRHIRRHNVRSNTLSFNTPTRDPKGVHSDTLSNNCGLARIPHPPGQTY